MTLSDLGYLVLGMAIPVAFNWIIAYLEDRQAIKDAVDGNDMVVRQPSPEQAYDYTEREARRVERPAYERSVPGIVVREVDIDLAHRVVNAKPGSITFLAGARAE